jgi:CspA family cold shock protein
MKGTIKNVYPEKGFGFIRGEDYKSYFFHRSGLKNATIDQIGIGQEVTFEECEGEKGLRAEDVFV